MGEESSFKARLCFVGWAALGGGIGSLARYGLDTVFSTPDFLGGIWIANLAGCFLLALSMALAPRLNAHARHFWATGLCGGLTTFSTVNLHVWILLESARFTAAFFETFGMLAGCLFAVWVGMALRREKEADL